jgi:hypothetical protein
MSSLEKIMLVASGILAFLSFLRGGLIAFAVMSILYMISALPDPLLSLAGVLFIILGLCIGGVIGLVLSYESKP